MLMRVWARDDNDAVDKISEILPKMHSVVIGPGLGRDSHLLTVVKVCNFHHFFLSVNCQQARFLHHYGPQCSFLIKFNYSLCLRPKENVGYQFSKNRTDLKIQKPKTQFPQFGFKNRLRRFGDGFSRWLIHNSSSNVIGSTVKIFSSCHISALLSHFNWQLVGPIQHGRVHTH